jgi:hypothetical protein
VVLFVVIALFKVTSIAVSQLILGRIFVMVQLCYSCVASLQLCKTFAFKVLALLFAVQLLNGCQKSYLIMKEGHPLPCLQLQDQNDVHMVGDQTSLKEEYQKLMIA